jgi:beta-aspartyl-peptidase (threonine type)
VAAYDIAALMKYKGLSVHEAAVEVIGQKLKQAGGEGGVIALDAKGNFAAPYNTPGLFRGYVTGEGTIKVRLYAE